MAAIKVTPADNHHLLVSKGKKPRSGDVKACETCGKEFYRKPSEIKVNNRFCSLKCFGESIKNRNEYTCRQCGEKFEIPKSVEKLRSTPIFCSKKCRGLDKREAQKGENNPSWKGGVSKESRRLRSSAAFKEWREKVFKRDDYTCQECGKRGGYLEPDHIKPFAYFPELRFDVDNGRTLCKECHRATDTYGHKATARYGETYAGN
ncbi:MAG: HNH endonuclease signature motif containing protein [Candidatus Thiodiazotropha sp.]